MTLRFFNLSFTIIFIAFICVTCRQSPKQGIYDIHKSAISTKGMVVTAHPLATDVGIEILKQGGNAADAAIAVQLALAVVYPRAGNLGGGGFMVYRDKTGKITTLDFRERAPEDAHRDMYLDSSGQVIQGLSKTGILAAGVPGTVAGLVETHRLLGKLDWPSLFEPAIKLAEKGFRITTLEASRLNSNQEIFSTLNPPEMPFLKDEPWQEGDRLIQKELAATLKLIAQHGRDGFYSGKNANALEQLSASKNGIITKTDLMNYKPIWREPMTISWRGYEIHTMGLPSSGGILISQILQMIDPHLKDDLGPHHPDNIHLLVEAERRAFEDRSIYLGDLDYYPVSVDSILDSSYIAVRFNNFDTAKATLSIHPDSSSLKLSKEIFETTHFSIVDGEGNAASVTTTLNDNYGSKVWVSGGGYFLNNEMDDFSIKPGEPNMFGLIGAEANAIAPNKRMLSSMTPTIVEKEDKLWLVLGTPGGPTIITSVLQVFLDASVYNMNIDDAVQASRFHHQWLPDEIMYERNGFSEELINELTNKGHTLKPLDALGLIEAIMVERDSVLHGAADRRGEDDAKGL